MITGYSLKPIYMYACVMYVKIWDCTGQESPKWLQRNSLWPLPEI